MDQRLKTLLLLATGAAVGAGGTFVAVDDNLNLTDDDSVKVYKGATLAVHAISMRRDKPTGFPSLAVYSSVQTDDGGVEDLGEVRCGLDAGEQTKLRTIMNSNVVEKCAQGDSGVALAQLFVHALDLRRRAVPLDDGGVDLSFEMEAYATRQLADGGTLDLGHGFTCPMPDAGQAQFDLIGLVCVKRAKGLGK